MNTESESKSNLSEFIETVESDKKDDGLASLELKVQKLQDRINEDRFIFIGVITIFFDCLVFPSLNNWGGPISIFIIELIIIIVAARRLGIEDISQLVDKLVHVVTHK